MAIVFFFVKKILPLDKYLGSIGEALLLGIVWSALYFLLMRKKMKLAWNKLKHTGV
jgi:hypothetical protein